MISRLQSYDIISKVVSIAYGKHVSMMKKGNHYKSADYEKLHATLYGKLRDCLKLKGSVPPSSLMP